MKKVLSFFSRPDDDLKETRPTYVSREPTLDRDQINRRHDTVTKSSQSAQPKNCPPPPEFEQMPLDYKGIVEFFQKKVRDRRSPYNGLVAAADCLKEFIPDETSRLKAVLAVCGDKWPLDALSLAISTHISDIELARNKARADTRSQSSERAARLQVEADQIKQKNARIESEIRVLGDSIQKLEANLNANRATLASLNEQIQLAQGNASSGSFVDQAAENLKNDLLARKVILGLP